MSKITAGSGISVSPTSGLGNVTITGTGAETNYFAPAKTFGSSVTVNGKLTSTDTAVFQSSVSIGTTLLPNTTSVLLVQGGVTISSNVQTRPDMWMGMDDGTGVNWRDTAGSNTLVMRSVANIAAIIDTDNSATGDAFYIAKGSKYFSPATTLFQIDVAGNAANLGSWYIGSLSANCSTCSLTTALGASFGKSGTNYSVGTSSGIRAEAGTVSMLHGSVRGNFNLTATSSMTTAGTTSISGSTITVTQYAMTDFYSLVASSFPAQATNGVTFNLDYTTGSWRFNVDWAGVSATTGTMVVVINGSSASNYAVYTNNGNGNGPYNNSAATRGYFFNDTPTDTRVAGAINQGGSARFDFSINPAKINALRGTFMASIWDAALTVDEFTWGSIAYVDASASTPITNIRFFLTRGATWKGSVKLYRSN